MLKRKNRLSNFSLKEPKQVSTDLFNVKFAKSPDELNRFAFIVSKKTDPRATVRNKLRRKLANALNKLIDKISGNNSFIFYPKKKLAQASEEDILKEVKFFLTKQKLLNE